jgi:hypothetical protein
MYLKFIFLTVLDFAVPEPMQLLLFCQISKTLGTSAKNAAGTIIPKQTTLTELTRKKKIQNKFILYFKQNSFLLRMGRINQKFYCDTSVII